MKVIAEMNLGVVPCSKLVSICRALSSFALLLLISSTYPDYIVSLSQASKTSSTSFPFVSWPLFFSLAPPQIPLQLVYAIKVSSKIDWYLKAELCSDPERVHALVSSSGA